MLREHVREESGQEIGHGIGASDLARGLTFLRASNMQVMRLQLASEQADRRGMMAAIDELVGLDRELGRFIDSFPEPALREIGEEIEAQKRDLMAQRVVLARGKVGPAIAPALPPEPAEEPELDLQEYAPNQHWPRFIAALLLLCLALAAGLLFAPQNWRTF